MGLRRRTFLGLLTGFAGTVLGAVRASGRLPWWTKPAGGDGAEPLEQDGATPLENLPGIKITTIRRNTFRGTAQDLSLDPEVFYLRGEWRRLESPRATSERVNADGTFQRAYGPRIATIARPDLAKAFELNLDASEYVEMPYSPTRKLRPLTKEQMEARGITPQPRAAAARPTFRIETTTRDTGERKEIFGYLARHVITTRREIPLQGSRRGAQETITDGWYIDLELQFYPTLYPAELAAFKSAHPRGGHAYLSVTTRRPGGGPKPAEPPEIPEFMDIGEPETGFAVQEFRTSRGTSVMPDGSTREAEFKSETLVVALEKGTFDAALFDVPSGFRRVSQIQRNPA
jgi:hypothetical protein